MHRRGAPRLSYANVVATLALFVALGGTTVAATQLHGSQIKRGTITGKQVRGGSVPGADLRRDSVTGVQVDEARLATVPRAQAAALAERALSAERANSAENAQSAARSESAASADAAADAARLGGQPAGSYLDRCAAGTRAYAGACFEAQARTPTTWPEAAEICGDAGGRLPSLGELEGFRQEPGVVLDGSEHTSAYLDVNWIESGGDVTVGLSDNGVRSPGFAYGVSNAAYRCVKPLSNL